MPPRSHRSGHSLPGTCRLRPRPGRQRRLTAKTSFPDRSNVVSPGEILLFNSVVDGRAAILAHVYQESPGPITRLVVFHIRRGPGTFGTVLTGELPASLNRNGYLKTILLQIQRRYVFRGRRRAYLSAACPAPEGFAR